MSNEIAILQLIHTPGLGTATLGRLLKVLKSDGVSLDEFVSLAVNEIIQKYRLKAEIAENLKANTRDAQKLASQLYQQDIHILIRTYSNYPHHLIKILGDNAPSVLFAKGNLDILNNKAVGFSGSRKTSEKGLTIASNAAGILADKGVNVVSGYASGTDLAAHRGALSSDGTTTFVLVEGILHFKIKREIADYINNKNYLAISEFPPQTKWIARNAMQRNRTICGLSDAMIIVESGLDGGTFAAGETTLQLNLPLFVVDYAQPPQSAVGNSYFINKGATP
ncbi:MAG: DNA-binding protein, partial [Calothrix sp. SM1_7_51]|nr:DNA-binding protein [Calothrix sp. SM1_7_51]